MNLFNDLCFSVGRCKKMGDFSSSIYFLFLVKKKKGVGEPGLEPSFFLLPGSSFLHLLRGGAGKLGLRANHWQLRSLRGAALATTL